MHFDYLTWFFRRFNAFVLAVFVLLIPFSKLRQPLHFDADHSADKTNYPFVMIHDFQSFSPAEKPSGFIPAPGLRLFITARLCLSIIRQ